MPIGLAFPAAGVSKQSGGTLNMIAWEGYTQPQWVKPFEKQSGCTINAKYAGSSDEMVTLMRSGGGGQYDMVSASGDASLRLIYGKDVQPIDVSKIPDYKNFGAAFKSPPNNTIDGKHYGVSLQWGPNTLLYNTKKVKPAPTSWAAIYSPKYKGKVTVPDNPIQIADAALYLMKTQPSLGIKDPYELNKTQFNATINLLKKQKPLIKKYWALASDEIDLFKNGDAVDRRVVAVPDEHADRREGAGEGHRAEGRRDGLARHLDGLVEDEEHGLRHEVAGVDLDAEGAGPAGDLLRGDPGQLEVLRDHGHALEGLVRAVPRQRSAQVLQADPLLEDADRRLRQRQEGLHGLHEVAAGLDPAQGLGTPARSAPPIFGGALWRRPWLKGLTLLSPPVLAFLLVYIAALVALFVSAFWTVDVFTSKLIHHWTLDNFRTLWDEPTYRNVALRTIGIAAAVTLTDAIIAFPFAYFMARVATPQVRAVLFVLVLLPLWASYIARIYSWKLILNSNGVLNWSLHKLGLPAPEPRVHEHRRPGSSSRTSGCRS